MKIAVLAPPYLPVPPVGYGGTEKIISQLTEGLVKKGHQVTLFATGDSQTKAKLVSVFAKAIGNSGLAKGDALLPLLHYKECFQKAREFDIIHNHGQYLAMFLAEFSPTPVVHTIHGSYYEGEVPQEKRKVLSAFRHHKFVSISDNQRGGFPELNYVDTVYNGLDISKYTYNEKPRGDYLLWVGRIVEKKGPQVAINVAKKLNMPLVIAATVDPVDKPYFDSVVKPEIDGKLIQFTGELQHDSLNSLYGNAYCTLFPITWHEPFGLVMIESMATGTPVVAFNWGSVPEVIKDGKTGFVVNDADKMIEAIEKVGQIKRIDCRKRVEDKFSAERMVEGYEKIYKKVVGM